MKYVLPVTAILFVLWTLFAFLFPSHLLGLTDFQLGEVCGKGAFSTGLAGIVIWLILKIKNAK